MKRSHLSLMLTALAVLLGSCDSVTEPGPVQVRELTAQEKQSVKSDNRFGLNLFREISQRESGKNVFISPLSVSLALGMTLNGANGETQAAMEQTLERAGMSPQEINEAYLGLIELLEALDPKVAFQIANSIWYRQGFTVEQEFLDTNRQYFDAEVREEDFNSPAAVDHINEWVDEKTRGKITEVIDAIDPNVVMYLINAIYFKGTWQYEFDPEETRRAPFHALSGETREVDMMSLESDLPYYTSDGLQVVDLPYGDSLFSMTILLPAPGQHVDSLAASLTPEQWDGLIGGLTRTAVLLTMPRFKLEYERSLVDDLAALGMEIAFDPTRADFTGINRGGGLFISDVIHKTFVEVNEEGTEAAAVTVVVIELTSVGGSRTQVRVDRPFLFAIRERHSGTILFVGKVTDLPQA